MNAVVGESIATTLAQWYADHSSIRRLWAIEDPLALRVVVTLEPTSDGDDSLPIWLANNRDWTNSLRLRTRREVQLQLVVAGAFGESDVDPGAVTIAEVSWRDSWLSP